ncbi:MAG: YceD family protein [Thiohalomonadales bacterium]
MSRPLPDLIDPLRLVNNQSVLQGSLNIDRFGQLRSALCSSEGEVTVDVVFGRDQNGQAYIKGKIIATLWLICQRCLQPMCWQQEISVCLALVSTELEVDKLLPHYDPFLMHADMHSVAEIVEAEIILALPQIAMHAPEHCHLERRHVTPSTVGGAGTNNPDIGDSTLVKQVRGKETIEQGNKKYNPFAVLREMKKEE